VKILITVEYYWPKVGGAELVAQRIAEGLQSHGHSVDVATTFCDNRHEYVNGVRIHPFKIRGNSVKGIREGIRGEIRRYKELITSNVYDVVIQYAAQTWHVDIALQNLDNINAKKVLIPCGYSGLVLPSKKLFYYIYYMKLPSYLKKYDMIVYHSGAYADKAYGDKHQIKKYRIIPNGISFEEIVQDHVDFKTYYGISEQYVLLSVGNHYKLKNHKFIYDAYKKLGRSDVALAMIGGKTFGYNSCYKSCHDVAKNKRGIYMLTDIPRSHVLSAYNQSDIFVSGSSVECFPVVILEAMAFKLPYVSTNCGSVSELCGGVIVDTPSEMARQIDRLLNSPDARAEMGVCGYEQCMDKYALDSITRQYNDLVQELV